MSLTGRRFGTFTVGELFLLENKIHHYFCHCDCGATDIRRRCNFNKNNKCKTCGTKRYQFERRGSFDCNGCGEEFPIDLLANSRKFFYYCPECRIKIRTENKKKRIATNKLDKEKERIRKRIGASLNKEFYKSNSIAAKYLGVDKQTFMIHISSLFREGMSWERRNEFEIDHTIPMSEAKTSEDIKKLWHYTNLQPLWGWENNLKSNRLDWREDEWAKELVELRIKLGLEKRVP